MTSRSSKANDSYSSTFSSRSGSTSSSYDISLLSQGGRKLHITKSRMDEDEDEDQYSGTYLDSSALFSTATSTASSSTLTMCEDNTSEFSSFSASSNPSISTASTASYYQNRKLKWVPPGYVVLSNEEEIPASSSKETEVEKEEERKITPMPYAVIRKLLASRLKDVVGLNLDQDVRPYKDIHEKRIVCYRLRRMVGPFEFYLELANMPESRQYLNWFPKMQSFYQDPANRKKLQVFKNVVITGRCYVCRDFNDGHWHRVRVHSLQQRVRTVTVFYMDLCKLQEASVDDLLELQPTFAKVPYQVFRSYLYDISPADIEGTLWSPETFSYFTNLMSGKKEFTGIVLSRSDTQVTKGLPDFITTIGVVLVENAPGTKRPQPNVCTINAQMVDAGFAVATGVTAGCLHVPFLKRDIPTFDRSHFDRVFQPHPSSSSATSGLPKEDLEEALEEDHIFNAVQLGSLPAVADEEKVPRVITPRSLTLMTPIGLCFEDAERIGTTAYYKNTTDFLPRDILCRLAQVIMVYVQSPSYLIVHLKSKLKELEDLQEAINQMIDNEQPLLNGEPGNFVACHILNCIGADDMDRTFWCRGLIKNVSREDSEVYKVFLVDYGNEISIQNIYVRKLPECFQDIPSYAIRVHLDVENLIPEGNSTWSVAAIMDFRTYVFSWEGKGPIYCIYRPRESDVLELDHFNQPLLYNTATGKWFAADGKKTESYRIINENKNHIMMRNLFVSTGVEVCYEVMLPRGKFWHFESISDTLIEDGHAKKENFKKSSSRVHLDIIEVAESSEIERKPCPDRRAVSNIAYWNETKWIVSTTSDPKGKRNI